METKAAQKTVMLVSGDEETQRLYAWLFLSNGYHVVLANSGMDALFKFDNSIDIVVTDQDLAGLDGPHLAETLQAKARTPIVVITGDENFDKTRVEAFLDKSSVLKDLVRQVEQILSKSLTDIRYFLLV